MLKGSSNEYLKTPVSTNVDKLDKKIIWELLRNGRKSFAAIARENDVSTDTVWKRYKEMEKNGIIVGATIQYNHNLFGYHALADLRISVESQNIAKVLNHINNMTAWTGALRIYGCEFDLMMILLSKTLRNLERVKEIITRDNLVEGFISNVWVETRALPEKIVGYFPDQRGDTDRSRKVNSGEDSVKLDAVDLQVVNKLSDNGRLPFGKIAKEIGVSTDTIIRRYKLLCRNNYIKPIIQIDPSKLGYQCFTTVLVELSIKDYIKEVVENMSKFPGVHDLIRLSGSFDLMIVAHIKNCNEIMAIHEEIAKTPYVKKIEAAISPVLHRWPGPRTTITTF